MIPPPPKAKRKAKRTPPPSPGYGVPPRRNCNECTVCGMAFFLLSMAILGGSLALWMGTEGGPPAPWQALLPDDDTATLTVSPLPPSLTATPTPSPTVTRLASPTASPSPTPLGLTVTSATPPPTPTPSEAAWLEALLGTPPDPWPSTGATSERFQFFAETAAVPPVLTLVDVSCQRDETRFTLLFDPAKGDNLVYLEATIQADGPASELGAIRPRLPAPFRLTHPLTLTVDDTAINLGAGADETAFWEAFGRAWGHEQPAGVGEFSLTWTQTARHPRLAVDVRAVHTAGGGVFLAIRWSHRSDDPLPDTERLRFQIC